MKWEIQSADQFSNFDTHIVGTYKASIQVGKKSTLLMREALEMGFRAIRNKVSVIKSCSRILLFNENLIFGLGTYINDVDQFLQIPLPPYI